MGTHRVQNKPLPVYPVSTDDMGPEVRPSSTYPGSLDFFGLGPWICPWICLWICLTRVSGSDGDGGPRLKRRGSLPSRTSRRCLLNLLRANGTCGACPSSYVRWQYSSLSKTEGRQKKERFGHPEITRMSFFSSSCFALPLFFFIFLSFGFLEALS